MQVLLAVAALTVLSFAVFTVRNHNDAGGWLRFLRDSGVIVGLILAGFGVAWLTGWRPARR